MMFIIWMVGQSGYSGLTVRGINFLDLQYIGLGMGLLLAATTAGWIGMQLDFSSPSGADAAPPRWDAGAFVVGLIALGAYLVFFRSFLAHPGMLYRTLTGTYRPDRTNIELTVGVTSLVNCAPAFFSIYAYRLLAGYERVPVWMHALGAVLLGFTVLRVYAWSERLALIEAAVPFSLTGALIGLRARRGWIRLLTRLGPVFAIPALIGYFGAAEAFRSWASATYHERSGFWEFAVGRLASYYYTALNNGAGLLATGRWPSLKFEYTLGWLHKAPMVGPLFSRYVHLSYGQLNEFLNKFEDIEFNNPSGLFTVVFDLGVPGAIVYFAVVGFAAGALFQAYRRGTVTGILFYPILFITFLEVFRYPYLGVSRSFTWVLGIGVILLVSQVSGARTRADTTPKRAPDPRAARDASDAAPAI